MVEGAIDFMIGEKEGGKCLTKSNFVDDGKCPEISNAKLKTSSDTDLLHTVNVLLS